MKTLVVLLLASAGLYAQEHPVVKAVQAGGKFSPSMVKKEWIGNQSAHDAVISVLQQEPAAEEWFIGIKYLAVIDANDRQLAAETLTRLMDFAVDLNCFGSSRPVPKSKGRVIPEFAFKAKSEVAAAISYLIQSRINRQDDVGDDVTTLAEQSLAKLSSPIYWSEKMQWDPNGHERQYHATVVLATAALGNLADVCTEQSRKFLGRMDNTFLTLTDLGLTPLQDEWHKIPILCEPTR